MPNSRTLGKPKLVIIIEPEKKFRFRYESEAKKSSHGGILGIAETNGKMKSKKIYPTVQLQNYNGKKPVTVKVTLYTKNKEKHVLELGGKNAKAGIYYEQLDDDNMASFKNMTIINKRQEDVREILLSRKLQKLGSSVAPAQQKIKESSEGEFKDWMQQNLNNVVLCFEAFLNDNLHKPITEKLFSSPIENQKSSLKITRMSRCSGSWKGGDEVILLCDKIKKESVKIIFFDGDDGDPQSWKREGYFNKCDVHHQVAIPFKTPQYKEDVDKIVKVYLEQDDEKSESIEFRYISDPCPFNKKKRNVETLEMCDDSTTLNATSPSSSSIEVSSHSQENPTIEDLNDILSTINFQNILSSFKLLDADYSNKNTSLSRINLKKLQEDMNIPEPCFSEGLLNVDQSSDSAGSPSNFNLDRLQEYAVIKDLFPNDDIFTNFDEPTSIQTDSVSIPYPQKQYIPVKQKSDSLSANMEVIENSYMGKRKSSSKNININLKTDQMINDAKQQIEKKKSDIGLHDQVKNQDEFDIICGLQKIKLHSSDVNSVPQFEDKNIPQHEDMIETLDDIQMSKRKYIYDIKQSSTFLKLRDNFGNTLLHLSIIHGKYVNCILKMNKILNFNIVNIQNKKKQKYHIHIIYNLYSVEFQNYHLRNIEKLASKDAYPYNLIKTAIHLATEKNNIHFLELLLKHGADPTLENSDGYNCFHIASEYNFASCLKKLCQHHDSPGIDAFNYEGLSPLHIAILKNSVESCYALLNVANINTLDKKSGRSPLHYAVENNSSLVSLLLEQRNINVNCEDFIGNSPLHLACTLGYSDVVNKLLEAGANPRLEKFVQVIENSDSEESSNYEVDYSTQENILKILAAQAVQRENSALSDSEVSDDELEYANKNEVINTLDKQICKDDWEKIIVCMGMDECHLDTILKFSPSISTFIFSNMKKHYGHTYINKLKNIFEIADVPEALQIIKEL